jgi:hypothetical protein
MVYFSGEKKLDTLSLNQLSVSVDAAVIACEESY